MPRINVDTAALVDHRVKLLAKRLGTDRSGALGRLLLVWHASLEAGRYHLTAEVVDVAAETDGMAMAMIDAGLAREEPEGVYISGTRGRIEWLQTCQERAQAGGRARAANARREHGRFAVGNEANTPPANDQLQPTSYTSAPAPAPAPVIKDMCVEASASTPPLPVTECQPKNRPKKGESEEERGTIDRELASYLEWFNRNFSRQLTGTGELRGQVKALLRAGYSQRDLRAVSWYLRGQWLGDVKMESFLEPVSILRPTKFEHRLALANEGKGGQP